MHRIYFTGSLCGILRHPRHKRMLLMGRFSLDAANTRLAVSDRSSIHLAFSRPGTVKCKHLVIIIIHI